MIKSISTINRVNIILDNVDNKMIKLDKAFNLIDAITDNMALITDTVIDSTTRFIRKFFPKGKSIDNHTKETVKNNNITLLNTPIKSLDGYTPKEAFISVYGEDLYNKVFDIVNGERK